MGGFVAGSIIGKLLLDKSGWNQSVSEVAKDEKTLSGISSRTSMNFQRMGRTMAIAGTAIVGTFGLLIRNYVRAGDEIDKMAKRTGFSAVTLSELRYAAQIAGADINALEKGVKRMSSALFDAENGLMESKRAFDALGLSTKDLMAMKPEDQFLTIAEAIGKIENPTLKAALAQDIFGRSGTQLLPLFAEGKEGLKKLREEAHKLGIVFDEEAAAKAAKLQDAQTSLKSSIQGLGFTIAENLIPIITKIVQKITDVIAKITAWTKEHPLLTEALIKMAGALGAVMSFLGPMLIILPKLVGIFTSLVNPITAVAVGIGLLIMKTKEFINTYKKAQELWREEEVATGEKASWLTRTLYNLNAAWTKVTTGLDLNRIAMARSGEAHEALKERADVLVGGIGFLNKALQVIPDLLNKVSGEMNKVGEEVKKVEEKLKVFVETVETKLHPALSNLINITETVENAQESLGDTYQTKLAPSAINAIDVINRAQAELGSRTFQILESVKSKWSEVADGIRTKWATEISNMLQGVRSFKDMLSGLWNAIKTEFFDMVGEMISKWIFDFLRDALINSTKDAVEEVVETVKGIEGGITDAIKGMSGVATGLWTAAGAFAGTLLGNLIGGGAAGFDHHDSGNLQELRDLQQNTRDLLRIDFTNFAHIMKDHLAQIESFTGTRIPNIIKTSNDLLRQIRNNLKDIPSGQHGLNFYSGSQGGIVKYHPREQVTVTPNVNLNQQFQTVIMEKPTQWVIKIVQDNLDRLNIRVPTGAMK